MDLTTDIVFGADYCGDEVNELAVASFNYVKQDIADVKKRYMSLGFHLHEMEMRRYHEELGYDNFYECIEKNFHMDKSAVSRVIAVWKEFCSKDNSNSGKVWIDDRYEKYSYSQLVEMLPLKEKERFKVNADMTVSQIRNYKKSLKEQTSKKKNPGLTWLSSNPDVAQVSTDGTVTAVGDGETVILAVSPEGRADACYVAVGAAAWRFRSEDELAETLTLTGQLPYSDGK